jgi:hypothetical protein
MKTAVAESKVSTRGMRVAIVSILALVALVIAVGLGLAGPLVFGVLGDPLVWKARALAGRNPRWCGEAHLNEDIRRISDCVENSFKEHEAFRVRFPIPTVDEWGAFELVGTRGGDVYHVSMLGGSPDGRIDLFGYQLEARECPKPILFKKWNAFSSRYSAVDCLH